ncbi:MAG TPA: hypothetical protein VMM58_04940 [Bacteroidota bacterium]|nr:hypothetical protein [Bacteroidota bacterium]
MGQQQMLLMILGSIVVSMAVYTGVRLFEVHNQEQNRDRIQTELMHIYVIASEYKMKPKSLGGGGGSYNGFELPNAFVIEPDVWYWIGPSDQTLSMFAYGTVIGNDGANPVRVTFVAPYGSQKYQFAVAN